MTMFTAFLLGFSMTMLGFAWNGWMGYSIAMLTVLIIIMIEILQDVLE